jgi:hypothetical protein
MTISYFIGENWNWMMQQSSVSDDAIANIFSRHHFYWKHIEEEVTEWVSLNWEKWQREKPKWFTNELIKSIPLSVLSEDMRTEVYLLTFRTRKDSNKKRNASLKKAQRGGDSFMSLNRTATLVQLEHGNNLSLFSVSSRLSNLSKSKNKLGSKYASNWSKKSKVAAAGRAASALTKKGDTGGSGINGAVGFTDPNTLEREVAVGAAAGLEKPGANSSLNRSSKMLLALSASAKLKKRTRSLIQSSSSLLNLQEASELESNSSGRESDLSV